MNLDSERIYCLFGLFSDIPEQNAGRWKGLCDGAAEVIAGRLRENTDVSRHMERLCTAAAAWAYGDYLMLTAGSGNADELRVGDISLKNSGGKSAGYSEAEEIRAYFLSRISDLIVPQVGFAFRQTEDENELPQTV